jgi:ABC-type phosphate transport system substrate-binding protein
VFTGRGQPPAELGDSAAVRRKVADNPEAIGYIERSALDASVRQVLVVQ